MDEVKLNFEETNSSTWRKVEAKIREREARLLHKLRSDLPELETAKIRGALRELEILAGIAYESESPP